MWVLKSAILVHLSYPELETSTPKVEIKTPEPTPDPIMNRLVVIDRSTLIIKQIIPAHKVSIECTDPSNELVCIDNKFYENSDYECLRLCSKFTENYTDINNPS